MDEGGGVDVAAEELPVVVLSARGVSAQEGYSAAARREPATAQLGLHYSATARRERKTEHACVRGELTKSTERCAVADVATTAPTMRRREAMPCGCRWRTRTLKAEQA